jgi:RNA polymerase-binding protein DksA
MNARHCKLFRQRLLAMRERLTGAIERMSETVLTDARPAGEHDQGASETVAKEVVLEMDEESIRSQVMEALARLDDGTFGNCTRCGQPISGQRLEAMPFAPYCIQCEREAETAEPRRRAPSFLSSVR